MNTSILPGTSRRLAVIWLVGGMLLCFNLYIGWPPPPHVLVWVMLVLQVVGVVYFGILPLLLRKPAPPNPPQQPPRPEARG